MEKLIPCLNDAKVLNLTDQREISDVLLSRIVKETQVHSFCVNGCGLSRSFLSSVLESRTIRDISIVDVELSDQEIEWFLEEISRTGKNLKVYTDRNLNEQWTFATNQEDWFLDMKLDIFNMWSNVCENC
jgi:hypothetical protein